MNLKQGDGTLHEFTDALHAYPQNLRDLAISEAFGSQQYTLALFRREPLKSTMEMSPALLQNDTLLGTWSRVCLLPNQRTELIIAAPRPASLEPVNVHREIVGHAKNPRTKVIFRVMPHATSDQTKKRLLDYVFSLIEIHAQAT
jgi:hypothetical protein